MPQPALAIGLLLAAAVVIYLACEVFVNGVEWVGRVLAVGEKATGTVLAAFGTALPESVVTFVAVVFGAGAAQKALGVGAALGGPLVLSTLAYAVVGAMLLIGRRRLERTPAARAASRRLSRDQGWFLIIFVAKVGLGLVAFAFKPALGALFLVAYGVYFRAEMRGGQAQTQEDPRPLFFARALRDAPARPPAWLAIVQTLLALAAIFAASQFFVVQMDTLGPYLGLPPQLLALLISPVATELPEIMNAVIWVRQGKHGLALANISGAMMIQATVPTAFGLFFTPWRLDPPLILGAGITMLAMALLAVAFARDRVTPRGLLAVGSLYGLFVIALVALRLKG